MIYIYWFSFINATVYTNSYYQQMKTNKTRYVFQQLGLSEILTYYTFSVLVHETCICNQICCSPFYIILKMCFAIKGKPRPRSFYYLIMSNIWLSRIFDNFDIITFERSVLNVHIHQFSSYPSSFMTFIYLLTLFDDAKFVTL